MTITPKHTVIFFLVGLYLTLFLHDSNLYPQFSTQLRLMLSLLRFALLILPILFGLLILRYRSRVVWKYFFIAAWIFFLPYTIYSVAEIRHVSELCRLPVANTFYTEQCITNVWTLFPVFIYATTGALAFVFTVSHVVSNLISISWKKRAIILALCFYGGLASIFGLYSRVNVWGIIIHPNETLQEFISTLTQTGFLLNVTIFTFFTVGFYFVFHKVLRHAHTYII